MKESETVIHDCLVIGAGPGGLQAAIHLGRYNRSVLLLDRGGGSTKSAIRIENFLTQKTISGQEIITLGLEQAKGFGAEVAKLAVAALRLDGDLFVASTREGSFRGKFAILSTGVTLHFPRIKNLPRFFGRGFYTCVDCDGYHIKGKKLLIAGNSAETVRLAAAIKQMYAPEIAILLTDCELPADYREVAAEEGFELIEGAPLELIGTDSLSGLRLTDGRMIECQAIMAGYGYTLNDQFLAELPLARDDRRNILVNGAGESSISRLYVVGALRPGNPQAIIAAGQGAVAAIDINKRLLAI